MASKTDFWAKFFIFPPLNQHFLSIYSQWPLNIALPNQMASLVYLEIYESSKKPIVVVLMEPIRKNRHKITHICHFPIQIWVPQNEYKIVKMKNPDIDNQMSGTCGQYELLYSSWNVFFRCVIAQYFISFLFEHPACSGMPT